jgi:hypothetical protein
VDQQDFEGSRARRRGKDDEEGLKGKGCGKGHHLRAP